MITEKHIKITLKTPYTTLGECSQKTRIIWVVFHGYKQLAKRFIQKFTILDLKTNFIIAPQGLSKFYLEGHFGHVGASWMTKEDRETDIQNQLVYINSVFQKETQNIDFQNVQLNILGFSQGVTTACRWAFYQNIPFDNLILWAGSFPHEITEKQILKRNAKIMALIGTKDSFYNPELWQKQLKKIEKYVQKPKTLLYDGKHEVSRTILKQITDEEIKF